MLTYIGLLIIGVTMTGCSKSGPDGKKLLRSRQITATTTISKPTPTPIITTISVLTLMPNTPGADCCCSGSPAPSGDGVKVMAGVAWGVAVGKKVGSDVGVLVGVNEAGLAVGAGVGRMVGVLDGDPDGDGVVGADEVGPEVDGDPDGDGVVGADEVGLEVDGDPDGDGVGGSVGADEVGAMVDGTGAAVGAEVLTIA